MDIEARAQELVVASLLEERTLPGSTIPLGFPDLVDADSDDLLLVETPALKAVDAGLRLQRIEDTEGSLRRSTRTYLLEFLPPEPMPGKVCVRLRLSLFDPDRGRAALGELLVTFEAHGDELVVADEPRLLAT